LGRPSPSSVAAGVEGHGTVGAAIRAYAEGADLPATDARLFLRQYLEQEMANLDPDRRGDRVLIRAHRAPLFTLSERPQGSRGPVSPRAPAWSWFPLVWGGSSRRRQPRTDPGGNGP